MQLGFQTQDRTIGLPGELIANLRANHTERAMDIGWRKLRASGASVPDYPRRAPATSTVEGPRLLAALSVPLGLRDLSFCLDMLRSTSTQAPE